MKGSFPQVKNPGGGRRKNSLETQLVLEMPMLKRAVDRDTAFLLMCWNRQKILGYSAQSEEPLSFLNKEGTRYAARFGVGLCPLIRLNTDSR